MRYKYFTRGIVLTRYATGEASYVIAILTNELGLVHVRVQGVRKSGAKLAHALQTFSESDVVLVRGVFGWRLSGALLFKNWFQALARPARERAGRATSLLLRLTPGEIADPALYKITRDFFNSLSGIPEELYDAAECLAVLYLLGALGLDTGELSFGNNHYSTHVLRMIDDSRTQYVTRINRGIAASWL